jgi:transcriptional/translational regulatory protein YebC/TACO1
VAKLTWRPQATGAPVEGETVQHPYRPHIDALEDNDDVQNVYANFEIVED